MELRGSHWTGQQRGHQGWEEATSISLDLPKSEPDKVMGHVSGINRRPALFYSGINDQYGGYAVSAFIVRSLEMTNRK